MPVEAERTLHSIEQSCIRKRILKALIACLATVAVLTGVLGLLGDSWFRQTFESRINIHALFGLLLCGLVSARYRWCLEPSPRRPPVDIRELTRHLSRIVYLVLYAVIALRQIIGILTTAWHGGTVDSHSIDEHFHHGPYSAGFDPRDDFQLFLASGLVPLVFVRFLVFRLWLSCSNTRQLDAPPMRVGMS